VVTNSHVVEGASEILVTLSDRRVLFARALGSDPDDDVAVLRLCQAGPLPEAHLGDSDRATIGETAIAIGNPLGFENSVTVGVVSALHRLLYAGEGPARADVPLGNLIQTDAAINPGNSGGPLVDLQGRVMGMNTAYMARAPGLGFAVPANVIRRSVGEILRHGHAHRSWIGVVAGDLRAEIGRLLGAPTSEGALLLQVVAGGPAARAGVSRSDVITAVDGRPVRGMDDLRDVILARPEGVRVRVSGYRGARSVTWTLEIGERRRRTSGPLLAASI
jgi:serine protease Do